MAWPIVRPRVVSYSHSNIINFDHIWQASWNMVDFVSGGLLVPGEDLRINQGKGRIGQSHGLG